MKTIAIFAATVALHSANVAAFPGKMDQLMGPLYTEAFKHKAKRQIDPTAPQGAGVMPATPPPFDAAAQYVSNQGEYAFVAPEATDQRGECPGLNAMANHGYLPHDGYATIEQFYTATQTVYGMSPVSQRLLAHVFLSISWCQARMYPSIRKAAFAGSYGLLLMRISFDARWR